MTANPQYCLENTFDLDNMKQGQTTRVVFKAVFTPKAFTSSYKTFYKIGNNTDIRSQENLEKQIKTVALNVMGITTTEEQAKYDVDLLRVQTSAARLVSILLRQLTLPTQAKLLHHRLQMTMLVRSTKSLVCQLKPVFLHTSMVRLTTLRIKHFNELTSWTPGTAYGSKTKNSSVVTVCSATTGTSFL